MNMMTSMTTATAISMALTIMFLAMKEEKEQSACELTSFECGFSNMSDKKMSFSTNFITVVMLFIMFDIEVSIMIPMVLKSATMCVWVLTPISFLIILTLILLKEWKIGTIEWSK